MESPEGGKREGGSSGSGEFKARSFSEKSPLKLSSPAGLQFWDDDAPPAWIHGLEEEAPKEPAEKISPHAKRWKRSYFFFPALHWCIRTALGVTAATIFCFHTKVSAAFDSFVFLLPLVTLFASDHSFGATVRNSANLVAGGVLGTFISLPFAMIAHQQHVALKLLFLLVLVFACSLVNRHHLLQKFGAVSIILTLLIEAPLREDDEAYRFGDYLWFSVRLSICMVLGCVFALIPFVIPGISTFAASVIRARTLSLLVTCSEVLCELAESYTVITRPSNGRISVPERAAVAECLGQCQIFLQLTEEEMKRLVLYLDDIKYEPVSWIVLTSESRNNSGDGALVLKSQFEYVQNILQQLQRSYAMVNDLFNQRYLKNALSDLDIIVRAQPFIADSLLSLRPHLTAVAEKAEAQTSAGHSQAVPDVKFYQEGAEDHPLTHLLKAFESGRRSIFFEDASVHYSTQHHQFDLNHGITLHFFVYQVVAITVSIERALQHYCSPLLLHAFKSKDPLDPDPVEVSGTMVARFFPIPRLQSAIRSTIAIVVVSCFSLIPVLQHSSLHPFWAPMTLALIVDQSAVAGQLTKSLQRLQGIVLGPCVGYLIVSLFDQSRVAIAISVFVWIFFTTYSRSDLKVNPAWTVAGMGAVLTMLGVAPENSYQLIFDLLEQTVLGILIIVVLSVFLPEHNENELCRKIGCLIQDTRFCLTTLFEPSFHSSDYNLPNPPLSEKITKELLYGRLPRINRVLEMCHDLLVEISTDPRFWKPSFPKRSYREALSAIHDIQAWLSITVSVMELGWTSSSDSNLPPKCFVPMTFNLQSKGMQVLLQPNRSEIKTIENELLSVVDQLRESYQELKRPQFRGYYSYRATPSLSGFLENLQRNIEYMYIGYRSKASEPLGNRDVLVFYALIQCLLAISTHVEKLSLVSVGLFQQREVKYASA